MALPVIIDCDPGFDDMVSILLALASPELSVLGITTVAGNVPLTDTARNARRVCELANRMDIPVHAGCPGPLMREQVFGKYASSGGLGGDLLPEPKMPLAEGHAVDFIIAEAKRAANNGEQITLCAQAPLTNIALAIVMGGEEFKRGIRGINSMGGAFTALGNRVPWAEFNFYADPHAARIVLESGLPVTLFPLDTTFQALLTPERLERIRTTAGRVGEVIARLLEIYDRNDIKRFGQPGGPLHDPMVTAALLRPDLFSYAPIWVGVETDSPVLAGHSYADLRGKTERTPNARLAEKVDAEGYFALITERLTAYGRT